jgi:orotate phosphoribosyltransferase
LIKKMVDRDLQRANLAILARNGGFEFTKTFVTYTSDEIGNYYVHSENALCNGADYRTAVDSLVSITRNNVVEPDGVTCGESRDWCFGPSVAYALRLPCTMIYKNGKTIAAKMKGKRLVHVADLNNEGSSPKKLWVPSIRGAGGTVEDIVFYVDRLEDGVKAMQDLGLRSHSVVPLDEEAWKYLATLPESGVTPEILDQLSARTRIGKDLWAFQMLMSEPGRQRWLELFRDDKTQMKAIRVADLYEEKFPQGGLKGQLMKLTRE